MKNTQGYYNLDIVDCFDLERDGEDRIFNPDKLNNRKLLWHGSRFSNFVGILSQGMRIAPPEAPSTGYNFGKGVYFADLIGKSTPYCRPELSDNIATFVLCEVALGNSRQLLRPDYNAANLPSGFHSTHAIGTQRPKPSQTEYDGDIEIPLGEAESYSAGGMGANEFIVYKTNQIKMKYLVRVKI